MKTRIIVASILSLALGAFAQSYSIDWSTLDSGRTSTGGVYSVSGTIGQPDAGTLSGGPFTLAGGFWGIVAAVQTAGAPILTITHNPQLSTVTVSWPAPAEGWRLHATTNLITGGSVWREIPPPYQTNVTADIWFSDPLPVKNKFYRLHKP